MIMIKMVNGINLKKFLNLKFIISLIIILIFPLQSNSDTKKPWIGVELMNLSDEFLKINNLDLNSPKNIFVSNVVKNSAANESGIIPGDVIVSINEIEIKYVEDLFNFLESANPGDKILIKIYRNKKYLEKFVTLKSYPDSNFKPELLVSKSKYKEVPKQYTFESALYIKNKFCIQNISLEKL